MAPWGSLDPVRVAAGWEITAPTPGTGFPCRTAPTSHIQGMFFMPGTSK